MCSDCDACQGNALCDPLSEKRILRMQNSTLAKCTRRNSTPEQTATLVKKRLLIGQHARPTEVSRKTIIRFLTPITSYAKYLRNLLEFEHSASDCF